MVKYERNEDVLCYHCNRMYEARCIDINIDENGRDLYYVHYKGWNKKWDEWVAENRLLKLTPKNIEIISEAPNTRITNETTNTVKGKNADSLLRDRERQIAHLFSTCDKTVYHFNVSTAVVKLLKKEKLDMKNINKDDSAKVLEIFHQYNQICAREIMRMYLLEVSRLVSRQRFNVDGINFFTTAVIKKGSVIDNKIKSKSLSISNNKPIKRSKDTFNDGPCLRTRVKLKISDLSFSDNEENESAQDNISNNIQDSKNLTLLNNHIVNELFLRNDKIEEIENNNRISPETFYIVLEIIRSFDRLFNQYFSDYIIYPEEKLLFEELKCRTENKPFTEVFGIMHLLRFLSTIENLVFQTSIFSDKYRLKFLWAVFEDFMIWIESNFSKFLPRDLKL